MREAKIAELKAHLSGYLASVRRGESIVVCDRSTPIARLVPFDEPDDDLQILEPSPGASLKTLRPARLLRRVDVDELLREARGAR